MRYFFFVGLFLSVAIQPWGQMPSPSQTPEHPEAKTFGWSLKKSKSRKKEGTLDSRDKPKAADAAVDNEIIKVKTNLVVNDVLITDQKANVITTLKKDDFVVTEDGVPQVVEMFAAGDSSMIPRSIVIIIDRSQHQRPYLQNSIQAAKVLVEKLRPDDRLAIVTSDMNLVQDFIADKALLRQKLDSLTNYPLLSSWRDAEFETLMAVLNEMFTGNVGQQIVIFQTEGGSSIWLKDDKDAPVPVSDSLRMMSGMQYVGRARSMSEFGFGDVKAAIGRSQATIYSIVPGLRFLGLSENEQKARAKISWQNEREILAPIEKALGEKYKPTPEVTRHYEEREAQFRIIGQAAMFKVAELSGGNAGFVEKPEDAENAYSDIFKIIQNRYVIGYYPTNESRDGKLRQIKIEVRGHPEYTVTGRKAYYAPE